jgi:hypothetical protein
MPPLIQKLNKGAYISCRNIRLIKAGSTKLIILMHFELLLAEFLKATQENIADVRGYP